MTLGGTLNTDTSWGGTALGQHLNTETYLASALGATANTETYPPTDTFLDPNADVNVNWTKSAGSTGWELLDDAVRQPTAPTTGTDRCTTTTSGQVCEVGFDTVTKEGTITKVTAWWHGANSHATRATVRFSIYEGGVERAYTVITATGEAWHSLDWTADLTQAQLDGISVRLTYNETGSTNNLATANEIYIEIVYA